MDHTGGGFWLKSLLIHIKGYFQGDRLVYLVSDPFSDRKPLLLKIFRQMRIAAAKKYAIFRKLSIVLTCIRAEFDHHFW